MNIRFVGDKKNIWKTLVLLTFTMVMYFTIDFPFWVIIVYGLTYFCIKSLQIELNDKYPWVWTALLFAIGSVLSIFSVQYLLLDAELFAKTLSDKWMVNILCAGILYFVIQLFTNNTGLTCIISHITILSLAYTNYFVYSFRQNEFSFSDLRSIGTGLSVAGNYRFELQDRGVYVLMMATLFIAFVRKCEISFRRIWVMRLIAVLLSVLFGILVAYQTQNVNTETWEQKGTYRNGYVLNFILGIRDSFVPKPDGYSAKEIRKLEKRYTSEAVEDSGQNEESSIVKEDIKDPTVIVIMNESFADLRVLGEIHTNQPVTPFYDSLSENVMKGYALSSVFGAKTPNSEWEFLTGNSMAFLPSGSVVYQQYMNEKPYSLVSVMKQQGYTCVAMHPYYATGWSRNEIYPKLGYDEMHFIDDFDQTKLMREYITDEEMYDEIIDRYERRGQKEKLFLMGITMQNHGGYNTEYPNFDQQVYKLGKSYVDVNQYLSLIHESDLALQKLITYFENVDAPVEIVFFGDHQPSLNTNFYEMMNGKGLSGLNQQELAELYTVPFFIWTNYKTEEKQVDITSLNYLGTFALQRAGLELPPYNRFQLELMQEIPAINSRGYYGSTEDEFKQLNQAEGTEAAWINAYRMLQYNNMFDEKGRSKLFFSTNKDTN